MGSAPILLLVVLSVLFWCLIWGAVAVLFGHEKTISGVGSFCWGFFFGPLGLMVIAKRPDFPQSPAGRHTTTPVPGRDDGEYLESQAS